ncbi:hypothetical protein E2C01_006429 [Portunus trituberculatus]|uniref:Uncharacterized protein n=1 Tax=Portunus trituberculatus TaxID=210409 RepID=A0A5B7CY62_PORTR|nr:hypothetical protein [Portunus trituberculatus]
MTALPAIRVCTTWDCRRITFVKSFPNLGFIVSVCKNLVCTDKQYFLHTRILLRGKTLLPEYGSVDSGHEEPSEARDFGELPHHIKDKHDAWICLAHGITVPEYASHSSNPTPHSPLGIPDATGAEVTLNLALVDCVVAQREEETIDDAEPEAVTLVRVQTHAAEDVNMLGKRWVIDGPTPWITMANTPTIITTACRVSAYTTAFTPPCKTHGMNDKRILSILMDDIKSKTY